MVLSGRDQCRTFSTATILVVDEPSQLFHGPINDKGPGTLYLIKGRSHFSFMADGIKTLHASQWRLIQQSVLIKNIDCSEPLDAEVRRTNEDSDI